MMNHAMRRLTRLGFNLKKQHLRCSYCVASTAESPSEGLRPMLLRKEILDYFQKKLAGSSNSIVATNYPVCQTLIAGNSEVEPGKMLIEQYLNTYKVGPESRSGPTTYQDILQDLNTLARELPRVIVVLPCYTEAIDTLCKGLANGQLNKKEVLQVLYFMSLKKKKVSRDIYNLISILQPLEELSTFEKCIVADSCFKTGTKLMAKDIVHFENTLQNEIEDLLKDLRLLVNLCKVIRMSGPSEHFDPTEIGVHITNYPKTFDIGSATHILQLYAEMYYYDEQVLARLIDDIIQNYETYNGLPVKEKYSGTNTFAKTMKKLKYLDALLWSLHRLGYKLNKSQYQVIFTYMDTIYDKLWEHPVVLTRVLVCFWTLGIRLEKTVKQLFSSPKAMDAVSSHTWKSWARLQMLRTCVLIEAPYLKVNYMPHWGKLGKPAISNSLKTVHKILLMMSKRLHFYDVKIDCPIKGISILGVTCTHATNGRIHIDVLDNTTCLRNTSNPHGILNLKIRLIKTLGYRSVLIPEQLLQEPVSAFVHVEDKIAEAISHA